jgi:hypothetical protein
VQQAACAKDRVEYRSGMLAPLGALAGPTQTWPFPGSESVQQIPKGSGGVRGPERIAQ